MNQVESAALMLAGATLAFAAIAFAFWWRRRPRAAPAAPSLPRMPREPGESRLPKLSRKARAEPEEVRIAPARLARISGKGAAERPGEPAFEPHPPVDPEPRTEPSPMIEAALETMAEAALHAHGQEQWHEPELPPGEREAEAVSLLLVPQIPPRDAILTSSWLGGRPRLPRGMAWPDIDGQPADFLAQIDCAGLPDGLWDGLGPREGSLAFFIHRQKHDVRVLHLREPGVPVMPPLAPDTRDGWFGPQGGLARGELASFAVPAFPEWPVDLVAIRAGDDDPRGEGEPDEPGLALYRRGYDIADPAFHPFDWSSMTAMVALLEMRLDRLVAEPEPAEDAGAGEAAEIAQCAAINREARERAGEIIGIVHDSAAREAFSPADATAVMAALHAIRWARRIRTPDPETGAERTETIVLPLTTHRAEADLWVHDYQTILFDRAKHAWCANPASLSAPARALYEPWWQDLAAREMAAMGHEPFGTTDDPDGSHDAVLLELPTSGLMSRTFGDGGDLVVTIDRADLAIGDFSKPRVRISDPRPDQLCD